ncbi:MAG: MinD/ParA family protein [Bdellovibrionaceae bacterium]|nr:MinD/ParA family protein [Pseudobdellovibrionaceae bacterium]
MSLNNTSHASSTQGLSVHSRGTRTISITSGKGGVGKTSLVANIALTLGREGQRVLILDGDLGMANVDIMFGVRPEKTILDVVHGEAGVRDILIDVAPNVTLIPGGSGIFDLQNLNMFEKQNLLDQVSSLGTGYDLMIVDTAPGIADNVLYLNAAAQEINVVVTPDPASIADSYALIKVLHQRYRENRFSIICNQVKDETEGLRLFERLNDVSARFLNVGLDYKGSVPMDLNLRQATKSQQLVMRSHPETAAATAMRRIAHKFRFYADSESPKGSLQFFWEQLVGVA